MKLSRFCAAALLCAYDIVRILRSIYFRLIVAAFLRLLLFLFLSYCLVDVCVAAVYHGSSKNEMRASCAQHCWGDEWIVLSVDGAINAVRRDVADATCREETVNSRLDFRWTLSKYCRERSGMTGVGHFSVINVYGEKLVMYDRISFKRDTASGTWKRRWIVLQQCCAGIMIDARFADIPIRSC